MSRQRRRGFPPFGAQTGDAELCVALYGVLVRCAEGVLCDVRSRLSAESEQLPDEPGGEERRLRADLERLHARRLYWKARRSA